MLEVVDKVSECVPACVSDPTVSLDCEFDVSVVQSFKPSVPQPFFLFL